MAEDRLEDNLPDDLVSISDAIAAMTDKEKQKFLAILTGTPKLEKEVTADDIQLSPKMKAWIEEADANCPNPKCKCKKDKDPYAENEGEAGILE